MRLRCIWAVCSCGVCDLLDFLIVAVRLLRACKAAGIWIVVVPPRLTWRLQPLDTHCFLPFKAMLQQLYQQARARTTSENLDIASFLQCMFEAIRRVLLARQWRHAFDDDGLSYLQTRVHAETLTQLRIDGQVSLPITWMSKLELATCFPVLRRCKAVDLTWKLFLEQEAPEEVAGKAHGWMSFL